MPDNFQLNRREMLRHLLVLAGASASTGFSLEGLAALAKGETKYLEKSAFNTLIAVADTIIPVTDTPGALAADVPANLDALLLQWASPNTKEEVAGALARIDIAARKETGKTFQELSDNERKTFLISHEKAALKPMPQPKNSSTGTKTLLRGEAFVANNGYQRLKTLIVKLYYVSEIGMTQELVYEHVPGKWQPSLEITPGMRPFASPSSFL